MKIKVQLSQEEKDKHEQEIQNKMHELLDGNEILDD
jgi:hypothetical protein